MTRKQLKFKILSKDEWMIISDYLPARDLINFHQCCKEFYYFGSSDLLWKKHYDEKWTKYSQINPRDEKWSKCSTIPNPHSIPGQGFAIILSIASLEYPKENFKLQFMEICKLERLKLREQYEFQDFKQISSRNISNFDSIPITHVRVALIGRHTGITLLVERLNATFENHNILINGRKFTVNFVDVSESSHYDIRIIHSLIVGCDLFVITFGFPFSYGRNPTGYELIEPLLIPQTNTMPSIPKILLGTMTEGKTNENHIESVKEAMKLCEEYNFLSYYEISTFQDDDEKMREFAELCIKSVLLSYTEELTPKTKKQCVVQ